MLMDLKAANLADDRATRLVRASMVACFMIASVMLIASLAMAHGHQPAPSQAPLATASIR
jgi:hypothetical protein